jgi:hypothetical protein
MISFKQKGDFRKFTRYLENVKEAARVGILDKYGAEGVQALSAATPVDSGKTASSWYYEIRRSEGSVRLEFLNSHINDGVPIAIILQLGHGTNNGGWVEGRDYINPAIRPIFDKIVENAWREVTNL